MWLSWMNYRLLCAVVCPSVIYNIIYLILFYIMHVVLYQFWCTCICYTVGRASSEVELLQYYFDKYVHSGISMILEGIVDGRQENKMKTIIPVTNLNLVIITTDCDVLIIVIHLIILMITGNCSKLSLWWNSRAHVYQFRRFWCMSSTFSIHLLLVCTICISIRLLLVWTIYKYIVRVTLYVYMVYYIHDRWHSYAICWLQY